MSKLTDIGMMKWGVPRSLVLHQLPTKSTSRRAPGPIDMATCLPSGQKLQVRAGSQCIDGFWSHLRAHIDKAHRSTPNLVAEFVRSCQFKWRCQGEDPAVKTGPDHAKASKLRGSELDSCQRVWVGPRYTCSYGTKKRSPLLLTIQHFF